MELTFLEYANGPEAGSPWRELLSDHERDILRLVAEGRSAKVIARELQMSSRTVERHIFDCRRKLGARNNAHLVATALRGR